MKLFNQPQRDPERIDRILNEIEKVWKRYPDMRFYQLIALFERDYAKKDKFYVEDNVLEAGIEDFKKLRGIL
jgi:hypothetical protein